MQEFRREDIPKTVFKYRRFDEEGRSLRLISHSELWFASPRTFNDPFDASTTYNFDDPTGALVDRWSIEAIDRMYPASSPIERAVFRQSRLPLFRDRDYLEKTRRKFVEQDYNDFGICSLAGSCDNSLMWSHYADSHKGFCVGLSGIELIRFCAEMYIDGVLIDFEKVDYSIGPPKLNFFESMIAVYTDNKREILRLYKTKSDRWNYEEEWRMILWRSDQRAYDIGFGAITDVYLGCRISSANMKKILNLCRKHIPSAKLYQARPNDTNYDLDFDPM